MTDTRYPKGASYIDGTVRAYLDRLASAEAEPGGGSVAALVGALGAALITMVTDLTIGKDRFASVQDEMSALRTEAEQVRRELEALVTLDAEAYGAVVAAMKLPKETVGRREERERTLQAALRGAAEIPLRIAGAALTVGRMSLPVAEMGNPRAVSDAGVAAILAEAAAQSAALNVKINLSWIKDEEFNRASWSRVEAILGEVAGLRADVLALTYGKI